MAIEIRELIIKTVVQSEDKVEMEDFNNVDHSNLRKEILDECKKMIREDRFVRNHCR